MHIAHHLNAPSKHICIGIAVTELDMMGLTIYNIIIKTLFLYI